MGVSPMGQPSFSPELFTFLEELAINNDRAWFKANRQRYDDAVQEPALAFISQFAPHLNKISEHLAADARPVGGSLFRIGRIRDAIVRPSADRRPQAQGLRRLDAAQRGGGDLGWLRRGVRGAVPARGAVHAVPLRGARRALLIKTDQMSKRACG